MEQKRKMEPPVITIIYFGDVDILTTSGPIEPPAPRAAYAPYEYRELPGDEV